MAELLMVGGERITASEGKTFEVVEPSTAVSMAEVAEAGPEDARRAVDVALRSVRGGTLAPDERSRARPGPDQGFVPDPRTAGGSRPPRGAERRQADQRRPR